MWGYGSPSWSYVGPSWGYVGPSWGLWSYVGPSWGYVGPSWRLCGPVLRLCRPILDLCWPILGAMLAHPEAHVDPSAATKSEKVEKMGRAQNTVKRGSFWPYPVGRRLGRRPLSPTERRELPYGKDTARGPLAGFKRLRATAGQGPMLRWYGSSWEQDLWAMLPHLEAMLVHLGAMLAHLGTMLARLGA